MNRRGFLKLMGLIAAAPGLSIAVKVVALDACELLELAGDESTAVHAGYIKRYGSILQWGNADEHGRALFPIVMGTSCDLVMACDSEGGNVPVAALSFNADGCFLSEPGACWVAIGR